MKKLSRISTLLFLMLISQGLHMIHADHRKPRVFIYTDINIDRGDPDDRQSLVHLLWYANELEIEGIVPDRWNAGGMEASLMAVEAYEKDFIKYDFPQYGYPEPSEIRNLIAGNSDQATQMLKKAAREDGQPLYVLIWGNMKTFGKALMQYPELSGNIRVITIGTGRKYGPKDEVAGEDCNVPNWNGPGRNEIYNDPRFNNMWWLEINWTYNGMFSGNGPREMFRLLSTYGNMGAHIKYVVKNHDWAQYFRVGDTPSVLYVTDPGHDLDDPTESSWAGKFKKPFPEKRPNYYTDDNGSVEWDYADPCNTWENRRDMYAHAKSTLEKQRQEMYDALLEKLEGSYGDLGTKGLRD